MINYFNETGDDKLELFDSYKSKISNTIKEEDFQEGDINFIFCLNKYLLELNKTYLRHDYNTDVITFDLSEEDNEISGDIYISTEQVQLNTKDYNTFYKDELLRVMIHGVLHLIGYDDKTEEEKKEMRAKENHHINR